MHVNKGKGGQTGNQNAAKSSCETQSRETNVDNVNIRSEDPPVFDNTPSGSRDAPKPKRASPTGNSKEAGLRSLKKAADTGDPKAVAAVVRNFQITESSRRLWWWRLF